MKLKTVLCAASLAVIAGRDTLFAEESGDQSSPVALATRAVAEHREDTKRRIAIGVQSPIELLACDVMDNRCNFAGKKITPDKFREEARRIYNERISALKGGSETAAEERAKALTDFVLDLALAK